MIEERLKLDRRKRALRQGQTTKEATAEGLTDMRNWVNQVQGKAVLLSVS